MSTVLVVDDTTLVRESLARLMEHEGYAALRAADGKEAWAMLYNHSADLVLLDLRMPHQDGVTFLRLLRHSVRWKDLPVIVLTGLPESDKLVRSARALGAQIAMKATFGIESLLAQVREHAEPAPVPRAPARRPVRRPDAAARPDSLRMPARPCVAVAAGRL